MWEKNKYSFYHPMFDKKYYKIVAYSHFESIITNILFYDEHKSTTRLNTGVSILSKL
jgi:hypothetical protein